MNPLSVRLALAALCLALGACSSDPDALPATNPFKGGKSERELRLEADGLYKLARRALDSADFQGAIKRYDEILLRYPFTDYATQSELELVYAKYRAFDADGAISAADRFLKEHPRHPAVDYIYYLKGLVNIQRGESAFEWLVDSSRQDVSSAQRAFDDLATLSQKYPNSRYAADARERMVWLRNRIAAHELSVVKYYERRGAHLAAAKRAEKILSNYPGAPTTHETLTLLENAYRQAGLGTQAEDIKRVREANPEVVPPPEPPKPGSSPKPWRWYFQQPVDPIAPPAGNFAG